MEIKYQHLKGGSRYVEEAEGRERKREENQKVGAVIEEILGADGSRVMGREQIRQWAEGLETDIGSAVEDPRVKAIVREIMGR